MTTTTTAAPSRTRISCSVCGIVCDARAVRLDVAQRAGASARARCTRRTPRACAPARLYSCAMSVTAPSPATRRRRAARVAVSIAARALALARDVLATEADAIAALADAPRRRRSSPRSTLILDCRGRVVVSGIGKSGHIARKLAATLASTGTPAFFVHPAEARHGDLGMITPGRRRADAVEFRRDRRARAADAAPEAPGRARSSRSPATSRLVARAGRRRASRRRGRRRSLPARPRADGEHDGGAGAGRRARARAARRARLLGRGFRALASGRRARPAPADARARRDAHRRDAARPSASTRRSARRSSR